MDSKQNKVLERIQNEINRIDKKENNIYFFITSTHNCFDETIDYIYKVAYTLYENGFNVSFLKQEEDFDNNVWLSNHEKYSNIPVFDITSGEVNVGVSDILFIPEIFASVMNQTSKLPCKRIVIIQNINYLAKFMPISSQLGDFGIIDCLTTDNKEADLIKSFFPYLNIYKIPNYIDNIFYSNNQYKEITVNIVTSHQANVEMVAKTFYWKYPLYKWVTFKDVFSLTQNEYADELNKSSITIWLDENSDFGLQALEALASNNIVLAKLPNNCPEWALNNEGDYNNSIIWVNNYNELIDMLAKLIRGIITDTIPEEIFEDMKKVSLQITKDKTTKAALNVIESINLKRKEELNELISKVTSELK